MEDWNCISKTKLFVLFRTFIQNILHFFIIFITSRHVISYLFVISFVLLLLSNHRIVPQFHLLSSISLASSIASKNTFGSHLNEGILPVQTIA